MNQYAYQYIPMHLQKMYQDISLSLKNDDRTVTLPYKCAPQEILGVLNRCLLDKPDVFWLRSGVNMRSCLFGKIMQIDEIPIHPGILVQMQDELERKVSSILSMNEAVSCRTDSERLKFIYRYIQENTKYDYDEVNRRANPLSHTAYGSLVEGLSVCDGNTKGAVLLCQYLGIACMGVDGKMKDVDHSWLMVQSDGIWYHMDPTFRHTINGTLEFSHWLQSDSEISDNHLWDRTAYPICSIKNPDAEKETFATMNGMEHLSSAVSSTIISLPSETPKVSHQPKIDLEAIYVESMSVYQRILRENLTSGKGELKLVFDMGFGPVREEMLTKLFGKIASDCIHADLSFSWELNKENRYFEIRWE